MLIPFEKAKTGIKDHLVMEKQIKALDYATDFKNILERLDEVKEDLIWLDQQEKYNWNEFYVKNIEPSLVLFL